MPLASGWCGRCSAVSRARPCASSGERQRHSRSWYHAVPCAVACRRSLGGRRHRRHGCERGWLSSAAAGGGRACLSAALPILYERCSARVYTKLQDNTHVISCLYLYLCLCLRLSDGQSVRLQSPSACASESLSLPLFEYLCVYPLFERAIIAIAPAYSSTMVPRQHHALAGAPLNSL